MQFKVVKENAADVKCDVLVVSCVQKVKDKDDKGIAVLSKEGSELDKKLNGLLSGIIKAETFRGEAATTKLIYTGGRIPAKAVLLTGLGKLNDFNLNVTRKVGAKVAATANEMKAKVVIASPLPQAIKGHSPIERTLAFVQGALLGSYKFERYKDQKDIEPDTLETVFFSFKGNASKIEAAIKRAVIVSDAVTLVRDLVNTPAKDMTPEILAKRARDVAVACKLSCKILGKKELEAEKMNLILAVARGSENEPRFVHLHYKPAGKAKAKIALIGKGITFDSGGYNLKPGRHMLTMKNDMTGAATCIAVLKVLSVFKPHVELDAYLPLCDNMIDAKAEVPGNIIKSRNGKTVELINIDCEGRLVLADAISYALDKKPDYIIDLATLTGGVLYALGELYTAVLGNDQKFIDKYLAASRAENEHAWQLPLEKEYNKDASDGLADLKNSLKTKADTIGGALFLHEFVGDTKWVHLDIAESAWSEEGHDFISKGGTGTTVRTLVRLLMEM